MQPGFCTLPWLRPAAVLRSDAARVNGHRGGGRRLNSRARQQPRAGPQPLPAAAAPSQPPVALEQASTRAPRARALAAIERVYAAENGAPHRGSCAHALGAAAAASLHASRVAVANHIRAGSPDEIVFADSVEALWRILAGGFGRLLTAGDNVIVGASCSDACRAAFAGDGQMWQVKILETMDNTSGGVVKPQDIAKLLTNRTRLVVLQHVDRLTGIVDDLRGAIQFMRDSGSDARVVIDATIGLGCIPIDVRKLGADFLVADGLTAAVPSRIAILHGTTKALEQLPPVHGGDDVFLNVFLDAWTRGDQSSESQEKPRTTKRRTSVSQRSRLQSVRRRKRRAVSEEEVKNWSPPPFRFEPGMPPLAGAASIAAALSTDRTPEEWDSRMYQSNQLVTQLTDMLRSEADVVVIGSGTQPAKSTSLRRCGLLSFYVKGLSTRSLGQGLASQGFLVDVGNHGVGLFLRESIGMTEALRLFLDPELAGGDFLHSFMSALRVATRELRSNE